MPYYIYEIRDKNGKFVRSSTFSENKEMLTKTLQDDGAMILALKEGAEISSSKYKRKFHKNAKLQDMGLFANVLAILLENGVPLIDSFDVVLKQIESKKLYDAVERIKNDIESGTSFRDALSKHPKIFGEYWCDMMEAGELSGQLPFVIRQIMGYIEARQQMRKKIVNAFMYPSFLLIMVVVAVSVFLLQIVPVFEGLFKSFNANLPPFTQFVIDLSAGVRKYIVSLVIGFVVFLVLFLRFIKAGTGKRIWEKFLFSLPVFGGFLNAVAVEKFVSTLSSLLKSGIPILKALEVATKTAQSIIFSDKLTEARIRVSGGMPLSNALEDTGLFPPIAVQLTLVAEKTGNFSNMLEQISEHYKEKIEAMITRFTALLEPAVLVLMTVIVGGLLIALFMPIFSMTNLG